MANRFAQSQFRPKNVAKYMGDAGHIRARSSWETSFMMMCDTNPNILKWSSETVRIPYTDPLTNRKTSYVPDFFIQYVDKLGQIHNEIVEIKPVSQTLLEKVGRNQRNKIEYVRNQAKWAQARIWCKGQGLEFRILTEQELFVNSRIPRSQ